MQNVPGEADIDLADQRRPQHLSFLSRAVVHDVGSRVPPANHGATDPLPAGSEGTAADPGGPYAELVRRACDSVATAIGRFREFESTHTDRGGAYI